MNLHAELVAGFWLWSSWAIFIPSLLWAVWRANWRQLINPQDSHVWFAAVILLWMMWRLSVTISNYPGLEFHLLLVTTITLMFGWPFAVLSVSLAEWMLSMEGLAAWSGYALNTLGNGLLPIAITYLIFKIVGWWLPKHFFIYIYLCAFLGGALSMLISRLLGMLILLSSGAYSFEQLHSHYFSILPIMLFPEAFLNGAVMTLLVVFKPEWVSSFHDEQYLQGK